MNRVAPLLAKIGGAGAFLLAFTSTAALASSNVTIADAKAIQIIPCPGKAFQGVFSPSDPAVCQVPGTPTVYARDYDVFNESETLQVEFLTYPPAYRSKAYESPCGGKIPVIQGEGLAYGIARRGSATVCVNVKFADQGAYPNIPSGKSGNALAKRVLKNLIAGLPLRLRVVSTPKI